MLDARTEPAFVSGSVERGIALRTGKNASSQVISTKARSLQFRTPPAGCNRGCTREQPRDLLNVCREAEACPAAVEPRSHARIIGRSKKI